MAALPDSGGSPAKQPNGPELDNNYGPNTETVGSLHLDPDLRVLATRALARAPGEASEWRELWEEAGQHDEARRVLDPFLSALNDHTGEASDRQVRARAASGMTCERCPARLGRGVRRDAPRSPTIKQGHDRAPAVVH